MKIQGVSKVEHHVLLNTKAHHGIISSKMLLTMWVPVPLLVIFWSLSAALGISEHSVNMLTDLSTWTSQTLFDLYSVSHNCWSMLFLKSSLLYTGFFT